MDVLVLDPLASVGKFGSDEYLQKQKEYQDKSKKNGLGGSLLPMTLQYYLRNKAIKDYNHNMKDFFKFMAASPNVNYRYLFSPQESLLADYAVLEFGPDYTAPLIQWGKDEAKAVIAQGPGVSF